MKIAKLISALILTIISSNIALSSDLFVEPPKQVSTSKEYFTLAQPITVSSPHDALSENQRITELIRQAGGLIENNIIKRFTAAKITLKQKSKIKGAKGSNALQITVTSKKVQIYYTTSGSLQRVMTLLEEQIIDRNGRMIIQGGTITDWVESSDRAPRTSGVVDLTKVAVMSTQQLVATLPRSKSGSTQTYKVVSPSGWVIESTTLNQINPNEKVYSSTRYYTLEELKALNQQASEKGIQLSLSLELLSSNNYFERVTGFEFNSVEGMRFVRSLLQEWSEGTGIRRFVVVGENRNDQRFMDFLQRMKQILNIDITIE